ncbi:Leukocyte elastase inhibitor, partial [Lamellibrachia satsuma]
MKLSKAFLLLGAVLAGLSQPVHSLTAMQEVVTANNDFAMDLYAKFTSNPKQANKNIFFSAFSVSSALAMVYAGARGNTKTQMETTLKFDSVNGNVHGGFRQLFTALNDPTNNYTLSVANALFGRKQYIFLQSYINLVKQNYFALVKSLDFALKPEPSRLFINEWVANNTNQKIKNLLPLNSVTRLTVLVLVNAIYFKGLWKLPFDKRATKAEKFFLSSTKTMQTNMMNMGANGFKYAEVSNIDCKIVELPYGGDEVSMYILLPNTVNGLAALESQLTTAKLNNAVASMHKQKVKVSIPKFSMTWGLAMDDILKSMGITDMYNAGNADLSGIDGTRNLYVSTVIHKAFVDVNEEGTEAAAATAVVITKSTSVDLDPPMIFK